MKLQQLRYLIAVVDNGMNMTSAAEALFTSQPGVSKQVRLLEEELSLQLFVRKGKSLAGLTRAGRQVVTRARRILSEAENIKALSNELSGQQTGELVIATTPTQARYVLPDMLEAFHHRYPEISLRLHQGTSEHIAEEVQAQKADFAIASGESELFEGLVTLPIYSWERIILVPADHPLTEVSEPGLADLARHPIISYTYSFNDESSLGRAFNRAGVEPNVVFTAQDPDVIKNYVRKGMGIAILASMAFDPERDGDLVAIPGKNLFPSPTTWVGFRRDRFLAGYMYDFLRLVVPTASRREIERAIAGKAARGEVVPFPSLPPVSEHPTFGAAADSRCGC